MTTFEESTTTAEDEKTETFEVNITLPEPVYQIAHLLCQFENDLDWDSYVSELVRKDVMTVKDGDSDSFQTYVRRKLKNEKW